MQKDMDSRCFPPKITYGCLCAIIFRESMPCCLWDGPKTRQIRCTLNLSHRRRERADTDLIMAIKMRD